MKIDTEDFKQIKTAKDLEKAAIAVIAVANAFCEQVRESEKVKFAHCDACPFFSVKNNNCLKYFLKEVINEEQED